MEAGDHWYKKQDDPATYLLIVLIDMDGYALYM